VTTDVAFVVGYGIFAMEVFNPGDFLLEYCGELMEPSEADKLDDQTFVYYFAMGSQQYRYIMWHVCL